MIKLISAIMAVLICLLGSGYSGTADYTAQTEKGEFLKILTNKSAVVSEQHNGTPSDYVWSADDEYTADYGVTLQKEEGKEFKILNIADIHFSDYGYRVLTGVGAEAVLRRIVKETQPDLITLSGDNVCDDSSYYSIRRLTDVMESFGIPWAPVFGNHDDEGNCDADYLAEVMMSAPHCIMQKGDHRMGVGNYVINIAEGDSIVETLVMMDSHRTQPNELQQQWFRWVAEGTARISDGKAQVSLIMHIPLPEYAYAYEEYNTSGVWAEDSGGFGEKNESVCCECDADDNPVQRGFFNIIKETGNTDFIFCGHDHRNDYSVNYEGIRLTYFMKIGLASGVHLGFDGGTVITVGSDGISSITHKVLSLTGFKDLESVKY